MTLLHGQIKRLIQQLCMVISEVILSYNQYCKGMQCHKQLSYTEKIIEGYHMTKLESLKENINQCSTVTLFIKKLTQCIQMCEMYS